MPLSPGIVRYKIEGDKNVGRGGQEGAVLQPLQAGTSQANLTIRSARRFPIPVATRLKKKKGHVAILRSIGPSPRSFL